MISISLDRETESYLADIIAQEHGSNKYGVFYRVEGD